MKQTAIYAALVTSLLAVAGFSTPSLADTGQVAVVFTKGGFIVGGAAMVPAPHWVIFWVGAGIAIVGALILAFSKAMNTDWY